MDAVKKYQEANHLPATGSLDARTVRELNSSTRDSQIDTIIANMERWRWYPRDLGDAHVLVNQPDFTLKVMHNGVAGVEHAHRDWQDQHADTAAQRNDEIHYPESDLERAAIDCAE